MPGRDAHAPWQMDVPYATIGLPGSTGSKRNFAPSSTPISIHDTSLYKGRKRVYLCAFGFFSISIGEYVNVIVSLNEYFAPSQTSSPFLSVVYRSTPVTPVAGICGMACLRGTV